MKQYLLVGLICLFLSGCIVRTPPPHGITSTEEEPVDAMAALLNDNAILYYTMDQTWFPIIDEVNTLNLINGNYTSSSSNAIINNAAYITNTYPGDRIYNNIVDDVKIANNLIISYWFKSNASSDTSYLFDIGSVISGGIISHYYTNTNTLQIWALYNSTTSDFATYSSTLSSSEYNHVCIYFNEDINLYINGSESILTYIVNNTNSLKYDGVNYVTTGTDDFLLPPSANFYIDEIYYGNIPAENASSACEYLFNAGIDGMQYPFE